MAQADLHSRAISQAYSISGGNPAAMADVLTKHNMDGRAYTYDPVASKAAVDKDGNLLPEAVVYNIGTHIKNADGTLKIDSKTGKPEVEPLPGLSGQVQYNTMGDWTNSIIRSADPVLALAREKAKLTGEQVRITADAAHGQRLKQIEAQGKRDVKISEETGATDLRAAQAEKARAEAAAEAGKGTSPAQKIVDTRTGLGGEKIPRTASQVQVDRDNTKALSKQYEGITIDGAYVL